MIHVPEIEVILRYENQELARVTLPPGEYVIGRSSEAAIFAETPLLSRRHALLTIKEDRMTIQDLGSSNGTFVDEERIVEPTKLSAGKAVRLGDVRLEIEPLHASAPPLGVPEEVLAARSYAIGEQIARGGMGAILAAQQTALKRPVAMKVMLDDADPDAVRRFVEEAQVTGQLTHPNIVPIHELGVDERGQVFYAMKMVRGITLKKVIELLHEGVQETKKKYPLPALLTVYQKACDAVAFAHAHGVIHRDLKPENIMLGDYGEVLVMDWGLAKRVGSGESLVTHGATGDPVVDLDALAASGSTLAGTIMGTPAYMAPEQARGEIQALDARSDIYALGAILFELLHLRPTVTGRSAMEIVDKVGRGDIEAPVAGHVPDSLAAVVRKAMALDQAARYAAVEDFQRDITAYQNGFATTAERAGAIKQILLLVRRNKAASVGIAAVLIVGGALGTKAIVEGRHAEREAAAAKATLADLRKTAPIFYAQAKVDFDEGKLSEAVDKIGYAIQLDDKNADYRLFRAHLRESSQDLAGAAEEYRRVLALRPGDSPAKINLTLCEELLKESAGASLGRAQQSQLLTALREQKRLTEAAPLAALIDPDVALARAALLSRFRETRKLPGWNDDNCVKALPDGTFKVALNRIAPIDLSVLRGQPVTVLDLSDTGVSDLSSLNGLPLRDLSLIYTKVSDLSPLRGMPLEELDLTGMPIVDLSPLLGMKLRTLKLSVTKVSDLSPLAGMPLTMLKLEGCQQISDISPLRGAPLEYLELGRTSVVDIAPLAGAPLKNLSLVNCNVVNLAPVVNCTNLQELTLSSRVTDLTPLGKLRLKYLDCHGAQIASLVPLRGQPLRLIRLEGTGVTDLSPLSDSNTLEEIVLPNKTTNVECLRKLPKLRYISDRWDNNPPGHPTQTATQFWTEYDAQHPKK